MNLSYNCEEDLMSITYQIHFNHLDEQKFMNIVNFGIIHSFPELIAKVIDNYHFQPPPKVVKIPVDILLKLALNDVDDTTERWLENVVRISCTCDNFAHVSKKLLGKEVQKQVSVAVSCQRLSDLDSKLKEGQEKNWNDVVFKITKNPQVRNREDLNPYDVVVVESWKSNLPGTLLNEILESEKGLVFFHSNPIVRFKYSCF
ncbi:hypothetical protein P9112_009599 [Eukaryota sp. TZLM1-RC]